MSLVPASYDQSNSRTYYKDISNESMTSWGNLYRLNATVDVGENPTDKRMDAVFIPSDAYIAGVVGVAIRTASKVDVTLFRGESHNLTGRIYVTIFDD